MGRDLDVGNCAVGDGGLRIWSEARQLVGCLFRLHGRDPAWGLDCVGVALVAARRAGARVTAPDRYALVGGSAGEWNAALAACGLEAVGGEIAAGDIVLIDCGRQQFHLAVAGDASAIHAHRGLGRVVETPGLPAGAVVGAWRVPEGLFTLETVDSAQISHTNRHPNPSTVCQGRRPG